MLIVAPLAKCDDQNLSRITLQLRAEGWAKTEVASVIIGVDATLNNQGVTEVRQEILNKLNKIARVDWHITRFQQSQSESGLEQIQSLAEARLDQNALSKIRDEAKGLSRPGLNVKVVSIDFMPTEEAQNAECVELRGKIYARAKDEIARLNTIYPEQHYFIHSIDFMPTVLPMNDKLMVTAVGAAPARSIVTVSNKIEMQANVEISALPVSPKTSR